MRTFAKSIVCGLLAALPVLGFGVTDFKNVTIEKVYVSTAAEPGPRIFIDISPGIDDSCATGDKRLLITD